MAVQEPKKFLRIGVFRGKQCLEENVVSKRRTVSIGQDESNTFCILSSAVPQKWNLFVYDSAKDAYTLCVQKSMRGRVVLKNNVSIILDESLKASADVKFVGDNIHIPLTNSSRGRIVLGKINILFQFVHKHDEAAGARLLYEPASLKSKIAEIFPRALAYALLFSFLAHIIPLIYIGVQDWPRVDDLYYMPLALKPVEIKEMEIQEEDEEPPEPEITEDAENALPEVDTAEPEPTPDSGTLSRDELMDQITDKHREQGAMITAQILGADGGVEGFFADMLGSNAHIADMSDIAAGDIGASASGNLLNQLAAGSGGVGGGLLGIDSGAGNSGPKVVVDSKKTEATRAKVEFKMSSNASEFASAPPAGSKESIESMFKKKQGDIKSCYQRVMNAQGKVTGRFVISIVVGKDGVVMQVKEIENQVGGEMFNCVRQRIMNWKFGTLKQPLAFKKTWVFS